MIIGGYLISGRTNTVLKYNSSNLNNAPVKMESMLHERDVHACTIFKSGLHYGRPVMIAAGSFDGSGSNTAEILDFTKKGATWQESNDIFTLLPCFVSILEWLMSVLSTELETCMLADACNAHIS